MVSTPATAWDGVPYWLAWLLADFARLGGRLLTHTPLTAVERDGAGRLAAAVTPSGRIACEQVAVAAGAGTAALLERASAGAVSAAAFPLRQVPGFLLETPPTPLGRSLDLVLWAPDEAGFHLRPTAAGGLLLGADDLDALVGEGEDAAAVESATAELLRRATLWLSALPVEALRPGCRWRIGRRAMPRDGHSILGPLAALPGLFVAVTHSGVTLSLHAGRLLAEEMAGEAPARLAPFRPARFGL